MKATLDGSGYASGIDQMVSKTSQFNSALGLNNSTLEKLGSIVGMTGPQFAILGAAATAVGAALVGSVQAAAAFETSMSGVAKTTGLAGPDLQALGQDILTMSTNMPIAASELASIAGVAGSLGVAKENISGFTEAAAMMGVAFEMPADQAATSAAKILNSFGKPIDTKNMMALGNVVNTLADNFAATETQILDFVNRASFLNTTFGQTIPQVAALGTVMISAGMDADVASTGIKSLLNMGLSETSKTGGITAWAELLGTTVDDVKQKVGTDLNSTLVETADKIAAIEDPVERFNTAVKLAGTEGAPALLKLAGQVDNLKEAIQKANGEWENGSSMQKTFEANSATLDSQLQMLGNTINKAGVELGNVLLPYVTEGVTELTSLAKAAIEVGEALYALPGQISDAVGSFEQGLEDSTGLDEWISTNMFGKVGEDLQPKALDMGKMVGDTYSDAAYEEILKTGKIPEATADSATSSEAIQAAKDAGKAWADAYAGGVDAGMQYMKDENGVFRWVSQQEHNKDTSQIGSTSVNGVELASEIDISNNKSTFRIRNGDGQILAEQSYSFGALDAGNADVMHAVISDMVQGLAPGIGEAEVYDITGQSAEADKVRLQKTMETEVESMWDIWGSAANWEQFRADNQEKFDALGEDAMRGLYQILGNMENLGPEANQSWSKIWSMLDSPSEEMYGLFSIAVDNLASKIPGKGPEIAAGLKEMYQQAIGEDVVVDLETALSTKLSEVGKAGGNALANGIIEVQEQRTLTELADEFTKMGGDASDKLIAAILAKDWAEVGKILSSEVSDGVEFGGIGEKLTAEFSDARSALQSSKIFEMLYSEDAAERAKAEDWVKQNVADLDVWYAKHLGDAASGWQTQAEEYGLKVPEAFWGRLSEQWQTHSDWFDGQLGLRMSVLDSYVEAYYGTWEKFADTAPMEEQIQALKYLQDELEDNKEKLKDQTVGYDQLKDAIGDCSECAVSAFEQWQEAQDNLFKDSYIGPGGQQYLDWYADQQARLEETARAADAVGAVKLGSLNEVDYSAPIERTVKITADSTGVDSALSSIQAGIDQVVAKVGSPLQPSMDSAAIDQTIATIGTSLGKMQKTAEEPMQLRADANQAYSEIDALLAYIASNSQQTIHVTVSVDAYAGEIEAQVDAAIRAALA
jgi:TP901 family phage tail tape measure protein